MRQAACRSRPSSPRLPGLRVGTLRTPRPKREQDREAVTRGFGHRMRQGVGCHAASAPGPHVLTPWAACRLSPRRPCFPPGRGLSCPRVYGAKGSQNNP